MCTSQFHISRSLVVHREVSLTLTSSKPPAILASLMHTNPKGLSTSHSCFKGDACRHVDCSHHGLGTGNPTGSVVILHVKLPAACLLCCNWWSWQAGGAAEAQAALHEACHAIFDLKVSCHRHTQPRRKGATRRWEMIEMWPLTVSVQPRQSAGLCCVVLPSCSAGLHAPTAVASQHPAHCCLFCLSSACCPT